MRAALALLSIVLGAVYTSYGLITLVDIKRGWRRFGFSHFGAAWIAMAFTCGPHHLEHGIHLAFADRSPGWLELITVVIGLPAGAIWFLLRLEAQAGGRGDRFISGTPLWLRALPKAAAVYAVAFVAGACVLVARGRALGPRLIPNLVLLWLYMTIGWHLLTTQLRNRGPLGGWSVSGSSLTGVFFTCALMHTAWMLHALAGDYEIDAHGLVIDWLSVPAAFYFLWVVRSLQLGTARDWNQALPSMATPERAGPRQTVG